MATFFLSRNLRAVPALSLTSLVLCVAVALAVVPPARLLVMDVAELAAGREGAFWSVVAATSTWQATLNSLLTAGTAMLVSLLLGAVLAVLVTLTDIRAKGLWVFMIMLPMMIPPQVTALSWLQLSGPGSALLQLVGAAPPLGSPQHLRSWWGIALLMGIQHAPLVYLSLRTSLLALPKELIEAARLAGASQRAVVRDMILPLCRNGLLAGAAIAFVSALGNFGIPAMLGIPVSFYVLPTLIYQKMADFGPEMLAEVSSLSVIIGVLAMLGVAIQHRYYARMPLTGLPGRPLAFVLGARRWQAELALALLLLLIVIVPLTALVASSLVPALGVPLSLETVSLQAYREMVFSQGVTWRALGNSMMLAASAAVVLALICLPLAYVLVRHPSRGNRWLQGLIDIPYALPGVVLAVACILLFARPLPLIHVTLYGTLGLILFAYLSRFMTVCLKPIQSSMLQLDPSLEEAAQLCGAGLGRRLRDIVFPLLAPAAFAGMLLVFLIAVNELTVSALLWSAGNETLGVLVFNLDDGGETVMAAAVSVLIVLLVLFLMGCLSLLGKHLPQGVIPWRN